MANVPPGRNVNLEHIRKIPYHHQCKLATSMKLVLIKLRGVRGFLSSPNFFIFGSISVRDESYFTNVYNFGNIEFPNSDSIQTDSESEFRNLTIYLSDGGHLWRIWRIWSISEDSKSDFF
jgi:hypothetical protein